MEQIGRYALSRRLGSGSFATVWHGRDAELDVDVAVKVLADNWAHHDEVRGRFLAEARLLRRIRDARIVRVYDIGTLPDGRPYFVMDYAAGGTLADLRHRVAPVLALHLVAESARALHVLHGHDVIHRDVTPANLLLEADPRRGGGVLLADLGVAKQRVATMSSTMTAGTPAHMAPEQATGQVPLDRRADVYSLASVAWTLLTGEPPFGVRTLSDLLSRDPHATLPPLAASVGAPPELDRLLAASLSGEPGHRPPTAQVLAEELDVLVARMGGVAAATADEDRATEVHDPDATQAMPPVRPGPSTPAMPATQAMPATRTARAPQAPPEGSRQSHGEESLPPRSPVRPQPAPPPYRSAARPVEHEEPRSRLFPLFVVVVSLLAFLLGMSGVVLLSG